MTDQERAQVLKMIKEGKITPKEGLRLMQALEENPAEEEIRVIEPVAAPGSGLETDPVAENLTAKARGYWVIPLWIGLAITVLGG